MSSQLVGKLWVMCEFKNVIYAGAEVQHLSNTLIKLLHIWHSIHLDTSYRKCLHSGCCVERFFFFTWKVKISANTQCGFGLVRCSISAVYDTISYYKPQCMYLRRINCSICDITGSTVWSALDMNDKMTSLSLSLHLLLTLSHTYCPNDTSLNQHPHSFNWGQNEFQMKFEHIYKGCMQSCISAIRCFCFAQSSKDINAVSDGVFFSLCSFQERGQRLWWGRLKISEYLGTHDVSGPVSELHRVVLT